MCTWHIYELCLPGGWHGYDRVVREVRRLRGSPLPAKRVSSSGEAPDPGVVIPPKVNAIRVRLCLSGRWMGDDHD